MPSFSAASIRLSLACNAAKITWCSLPFTAETNHLGNKLSGLAGTVKLLAEGVTATGADNDGIASALTGVTGLVAGACRWGP
jgi:hypothetical protein